MATATVVIALVAVIAFVRESLPDSAMPSPAAPIHAETPEPTSDTLTTIYVVQPGDTLSRIADRFNTTVDDLIALNGLTDPERLFVGQMIDIPVR